MLKTAEELDVQIQIRKADKRIKGQLTVWHNMIQPNDNYKWNKKVSVCLRKNHKVKMIKDLKDFIDEEETQPTEACENTKACVKMAKKLLQV